MALNYGLLLASLILTGYLTCQAGKRTFRYEPVCEKRIARMNCGDGGLIIDVENVKFSKESGKYCQNNGSAPMCVASKTEEDYLICGLSKQCNGKSTCPIHMIHGVYNSINLPCRDHGISVLMDIIYECRHHDAKDSVINVNCDTGPIARSVAPVPPSASVQPVAPGLIAPTQRSPSISTINNTGIAGRTWRWKRPTACNTTPESHSFLVADSKASCICGSVLVQVSLILVFNMFFKIL